MRRLAAVPSWLLILILAAVGCRGPESATDDKDGWVGTSTTEDNVTTVANESGSVWGGTAKLVEELSIGVEMGPDEYMLGRSGGVDATDDRIYFLDQQAITVRAYDHEGNYLFSMGSEGQGPGEMQARPFSLGVSRDGRVFVGDYGNRRINVYSADGDYLADYPMSSRVHCCLRPMVVTFDGTPYLEVWDPDPDGFQRVPGPMQPHDERGPVGEPIRPRELEAERITMPFQGRTMGVMFSPEMTWTLAPDRTAIAGASHNYRFEMHRPEGSAVVVEKYWDPVPVRPDEREWFRRSTIASLRRSQPGWNWDGAEIPETKPAFSHFFPSTTGEVWVVRPGPGVKQPDCNDKADPSDFSYFSEQWRCWTDSTLVDVFDADGRFLGLVEIPEEVVMRESWRPWITGDKVVAFVSEEGVYRVKRYRLVLPGEGSRRTRISASSSRGSSTTARNSNASRRYSTTSTPSSRSGGLARKPVPPPSFAGYSTRRRHTAWGVTSSALSSSGSRTSRRLSRRKPPSVFGIVKTTWRYGTSSS